MSRVVLNFDDGTKIDFAELADALYHLAAQGSAGVTNITNEDDGKVTVPRRSIDTKVREVTESPDRLETARTIAKEQ